MTRASFTFGDNLFRYMMLFCAAAVVVLPMSSFTYIDETVAFERVVLMVVFGYISYGGGSMRIYSFFDAPFSTVDLTAYHLIASVSAVLGYVTLYRAFRHLRNSGISAPEIYIRDVRLSMILLSASAVSMSIASSKFIADISAFIDIREYLVLPDPNGLYLLLPVSIVVAMITYILRYMHTRTAQKLAFVSTVVSVTAMLLSFYYDRALLLFYWMDVVEYHRVIRGGLLFSDPFWINGNGVIWPLTSFIPLSVSVILVGVRLHTFTASVETI